MAENRAYLVAFGYAYGRMDAEDNRTNTSSQTVAARFADHWSGMEAAGVSRPDMFEAWNDFRATDWTAAFKN